MRKVWSRAGDHLCSNPAGGFHHYMWAYLVESSEGYSKYKELRTNILQANVLIKYLETLKATRAAAETLERS